MRKHPIDVAVLFPDYRPELNRLPAAEALRVLSGKHPRHGACPEAATFPSGLCCQGWYEASTGRFAYSGARLSAEYRRQVEKLAGNPKLADLGKALLAEDEVWARAAAFDRAGQRVHCSNCCSDDSRSWWLPEPAEEANRYGQLCAACMDQYANVIGNKVEGASGVARYIKRGVFAYHTLELANLLRAGGGGGEGMDRKLLFCCAGCGLQHMRGLFLGPTQPRDRLPVYYCTEACKRPEADAREVGEERKRAAEQRPRKRQKEGTEKPREAAGGEAPPIFGSPPSSQAQPAGAESSVEPPPPPPPPAGPLSQDLDDLAQLSQRPGLHPEAKEQLAALASLLREAAELGMLEDADMFYVPREPLYGRLADRFAAASRACAKVDSTEVADLREQLAAARTEADEQRARADALAAAAAAMPARSSEAAPSPAPRPPKRSLNLW